MSRVAIAIACALFLSPALSPLAASPADAADGSTAPYAAAWTQALGGPEDRGTAIAAVADSVIVAGVEKGEAGKPALFVSRIDDAGAVLWEKTIPEEHYLFGVTAATGMADGGALVSAVVSTDPVPASGGGEYATSQGLLLRLSPAGDILWQKLAPSGQESQPLALMATADGGAILAGTRIETGENISRGWLAGLAPDGTIAWQKTFTTAARLSALTMLPDGDLAVAGATDIAEADPLDPVASEAWVARLSPQGAIRWERALGLAERGELKAVARVGDGLVVGGQMRAAPSATAPGETPKADAPYGWIAGLDLSGTVEWHQALGDLDAVTALAALPTGGFAAGGHAPEGAWVGGFGPMGESRWHQMIFQPYGGTVRGLAAIADGFAVVAEAPNAPNGIQAAAFASPD